MNKPSLLLVETKRPMLSGRPGGALREVRRALREPVMVVKSRRFPERRAHKRFPARVGTIAILRPAESRLGSIIGKTLGDIAVAVFRFRPVKLGPIINISEGGLSFRYTRTEHDEGGDVAIDVLIAEHGFHLEGLAFDVVSDTRVTEDFDPTPIGALAVRFRDLTEVQRRWLHHFLAHHTVSPA